MMLALTSGLFFRLVNKTFNIFYSDQGHNNLKLLLLRIGFQHFLKPGNNLICDSLSVFFI
jgi:hypothetical protein